MKLLLPEHAKSPEHRKALFHEAEVGKALTHANVIRIVKIVRDPSLPYFVMEYFPSGSLRTRLLGGQIDFIREHGHKIFRQAATGLAYMNASGWVHRDVKPDNMLVNSSAELKLIDFAIAQRIPTGLAKWFHKRRAQGTRSYMAPEQIRGLPLDGRADVYGYGCTCYELTTGRPPFRGKDSQELLTKHITEKPLSPAIYYPDVTDEFGAL